MIITKIIHAGQAKWVYNVLLNGGTMNSYLAKKQGISTLHARINDLRYKGIIISERFVTVGKATLTKEYSLFQIRKPATELEIPV